MLRALLLLAAAFLGQSPMAARQGAAQTSTTELVARVLVAGDDATSAEIEALGARADLEAFQGLKKAIEVFRYSTSLNRAFRALRHFRGTPLQAKVIAWVVGESFDKDEVLREAATRGLLWFGADAEAELEHVVHDSRDALCRAIALGGLLAGFESTPTPEGLNTLLENTILGHTATRARFVEVLGAFQGEGTLAVFERALGDRDVSPFVKTAIVDALPDDPERIPGHDLLRIALRVRHPAVEHAALRLFLDRVGLDPAGYRAELARLMRSDDASVRRLATIVEGRIRSAEPAADQFRWLAKLARGKEAADRQAAAFLLAELGTPEAVELVHELLEDDDRSVASEALAATGKLRAWESIPVLIELLERAHGQPRFDIPETLRWLTGEDHGLTASRWRAWWEAEGDDFRLPLPEEVLAKRAAESEQEERREGEVSKAVFYGIPVVSERLVFVLDVSGSMEYEVRAGETRLAVALRELRTVLEALPDGVLVNVVFFSTGIESWQKAPLELTPQSRAALDAFIARQRPRGTTNLYDALQAAMLDRRIDTLVLLTDGNPEGGATEDPEQIQHEVARWNSTGHVVIHGVAVGDENELVRALTQATGGRYLLAE